MYGKAKMTSSKMPKKKEKSMPVAIMVAIGKPKVRPMPERGGRTATNMMKKSSKGM